MSQSTIEHARRVLMRARRIVAFTGAGISAESGVPTFRGPEGLWRRWRPEQLATPEAFARDPRLVWEWYRWRRGVVAGCAPNAAHRALAESGSRCSIVTQNVDGLHRRAAAQRGRGRVPELVELHGHLFTDRCTVCDWEADRTAGDRGGQEAGREADDPPRCLRCGALARPAVVWFGEPLSAAALGRATELAAQADACLVIGTSGTVQPAVSVVAVAVRSGATLIEVNPEASALSARAIRCVGPAASIVPQLLSVRPGHAVPPDAVT